MPRMFWAAVPLELTVRKNKSGRQMPYTSAPRESVYNPSLYGPARSAYTAWPAGLLMLAANVAVAVVAAAVGDPPFAASGAARKPSRDKATTVSERRSWR